MLSIYICSAILGISILILVLRNIKIKPRETSKPVWDISLILLAFFLLAYILTALKIFNRIIVKDYIIAVKDMLQILFLFIVIMLIFYILIGKAHKYQAKCLIFMSYFLLYLFRILSKYALHLFSSSSFSIKK